MAHTKSRVQAINNDEWILDKMGPRSFLSVLVLLSSGLGVLVGSGGFPFFSDS